VAHEVGAKRFTDWRELVEAPDVDIVCVATPNGFLAEISIAALRCGKHVLLEKPMGRNVAEARQIAAAAESAQRHVKVGFNHRYHPAIARAHEELTKGTIGDVINARARYGHGGRPGYENEWRGSPELAGGGELTDQGVHVADLLHWFVGVPKTVFAATQTAVWPLGELEDNAFAVLQYPGNVIASFHTSWTQWKNLFSLEIFGSLGSLVVDGLGRSYGDETLTIVRRAMQGGVPETETLVYDGPDTSWREEWADFVRGVCDQGPYLGGPSDGIVAMETLDALYRSARSQSPADFGAARK
jgi:predicted dehydrogenase